MSNGIFPDGVPPQNDGPALNNDPALNAVHVYPNRYSPETMSNSRTRIWATFGVIILCVLAAVVFLAINADKKIVGAQSGSTTGSQVVPDASQELADDAQGSGGGSGSGDGAGAGDGAGTAEGQGSGDSATSDQGADQGGLTYEEQTRLLSELARRDPTDTHALGSVDAPVVIIEYADLTCPYCSKFALETMPQIVENYVDKGLVRIEWRDLPLFGDPSGAAAFGGRAAGAQGKFWEFQTALFNAQIPRDQVTQATVTDVAKTIGLDMVKFEQGFTDQTFYDAISKDYSEAQQIGAQSTPTFLINGVPLLGAQEYAAFAQVIDSELAKVQ